MESKLTEDRIKPFRLVKYFTFSGITVSFLVIIMLSVLNTAWVRSMQRTNSEDYAQALIENLNHQVVLQFIIPVVSIYGRIKLSDKKQLERLDNVVRSTLYSFKVEALNIYSNNNTISYSFDRDMMGRKNYGGTGFQRALIGKSTSKLIQRGNFLQILLGFPKEVRLITFAPLRGVKPFGRFTQDVLGVVEFEQDLSEAYKTIFRIQILVVLTSIVLMGALFVVLIFVVKRGEGIIQKRAMERLRLKERLSRAEKLSAIGEMAAGISHEIRNPLGIIRSSAELLKKNVIKHDPTNTIPDIIVEESEIMADSSMLYQSFLNILINAMQAMPDGGRLQIDVSSNNQVVMIHFDDEGQGIPEDNLEKIWDPFFTTKEKGSGLGLGIVKNIIEAHAGSIQISNRPVRGARVTIELPVMMQETR
jgi:signal transduction histidine kinase